MVGNKINDNAKRIGGDLGIDDRMETLRKDECYLLLKDHKPTFYREKQARLINPIKNQMGLVSKKVLDKINQKARCMLKLNQLRSTQEAIDWFNKTDKKDKTMLKADIREFYPNITESLIKKALVFVKNLGIEVPNEEIEIILKAKIQIATSLGTDWVKINSEFDNSMGAKDSCELCELIGLFLLKEVTERLERLKVDFSIALYRDDLILIIRKHGKTINRIKSEISKVFTKHELELCDWEEGVEQDYLDIKFNIDKNEYEPYKKKNDNTKYLSVDSDHPDIILKGIPNIVETRINMLSFLKKSSIRRK